MEINHFREKLTRKNEIRRFLPIARSSSSWSIMYFKRRTAIRVFPEPVIVSAGETLNGLYTVLTSVKHSYNVLLLCFLKKL